MPTLKIRFTKAKESTAHDALTCIRSDGSRTWSRLHVAFPIHDMTHFALESTLHARNGFFGLLAQGWDITDFGDPEKRAKMPIEALWAEHVVGVIWREFVSRDVTPYDEFCSAISATVNALSENVQRNVGRQGPRAHYSAEEIKLLDRCISEDERNMVMARLGELAAQWARTPRGEEMEVSFDLPAS